MPDPVTPPFPEHAGSVLLPLARCAIAGELGVACSSPQQPEWLRAIGASFVTLTHSGELRGCIGTLEPSRALGEDVKANAIGAAFRDPRFKPLTRPEFDSTIVEVSVLSALQPIEFQDESNALAQLRPLVDGVVFEYGHHRATFLPVVWEGLREPRTFFSQLKYKAGLPPDFWDPEVKLFRYTVNKWSEAPR